MNWSRSVDLAYAASVLASYQQHWDRKVDDLLTRTVSYVWHTLSMTEYHIVSSREFKEGLQQQVSTDASHGIEWLPATKKHAA